MIKYGHAFVIGLQSNLIYRWNYAVRSLFWFCHLLVVFILWGAVFAGKADVGGFSFAQTARGVPPRREISSAIACSSSGTAPPFSLT